MYMRVYDILLQEVVICRIIVPLQRDNNPTQQSLCKLKILVCAGQRYDEDDVGCEKKNIAHNITNLRAFLPRFG